MFSWMLIPHHYLFLGNGTKITARSCALPNGCPSGSINLGIGKIATTCCNTDLCNSLDAPGIEPYWHAVIEYFTQKNM